MIYGILDADGTVTLNTTNKLKFHTTPEGGRVVWNPQLTISVTNKHHSDVQPYKDTFGGNIYFYSSQNGYYKWTVQSRADVLAVLGYFKQCSPHSEATTGSPTTRTLSGVCVWRGLLQIDRLYRLYDLRAFLPESIHHSAWQQFMDQWYAKI